MKRKTKRTLALSLVLILALGSLAAMAATFTTVLYPGHVKTSQSATKTRSAQYATYSISKDGIWNAQSGVIMRVRNTGGSALTNATNPIRYPGSGSMPYTRTVSTGTEVVLHAQVGSADSGSAAVYIYWLP